MKLRMKKNEYDGKLITFCGLDGCGKTTQRDRLAEYLVLRGYNVYLTKQPTDLVRNSEIFRTYMDMPDHSAYDYRALSLLAASDRVQHTNMDIAEKLKDGYIVLSDRYFYSCLANLRARGFRGDKWIYEVAEWIIKPDLAIFFDTDVNTAISRVRARTNEKDRFIDEELQYNLRDEYLEIASENGGMIISTVKLNVDECFSDIVLEVNKIV